MADPLVASIFLVCTLAVAVTRTNNQQNRQARRETTSTRLETMKTVSVLSTKRGKHVNWT